MCKCYSVCGKTIVNTKIQLQKSDIVRLKLGTTVPKICKQGSFERIKNLILTDAKVVSYFWFEFSNMGCAHL